jgi:hypothetical protein
MERHSGRAGRFAGQHAGAASRSAPRPDGGSAGSPASPLDGPPFQHDGPETTSIIAEQLDTIQQRLFALALSLGLAGGNSTDATTAIELRRLEGVVADLIVDVRGLARPLMAPGPDATGAADGDPRGRHDVSGRADSEATHGRDRR